MYSVDAVATMVSWRYQESQGPSGVTREFQGVAGRIRALAGSVRSGWMLACLLRRQSVIRDC